MIRSLPALALVGTLAFHGPVAQAQVHPAGPEPPAPTRSALLPDTMMEPPGGPRVVLLAAPGEGVAALRLSVPFREGPTEAGAGLVLRDLAHARMQALARPVGARVEVSRTPWGLAYAVEGAAADFEYLAYLLRAGVDTPPVEGTGFQRARGRLRELAARARETPAGRVAAELRVHAAPDVPPLWGVPGSTEPPDRARVLEVWLRTHQASAMTLVVSAPVVPEVVLAATRGMGAPESAAAGPLDAPAPPEDAPPRPDALRRWYGEAWQSGAAGDPRGPVAALLVADHLRRTAGDAGMEIGVELWELPDRWVLAVIGAAYERRATAMRAVVGGALSSTREALRPDAVEMAVARARGDVLLRSRTPSGLVESVGRAMDASGDPAAAARRMEALERMDATDIADFLDGLIAGGTVRVEVAR